MHRHHGLQVQLFFGRNLVFGSDPQHIAGLTHAQALGLQNDVERLIPRHILQTQGHRAGHRVRGHDVEVGEVGNHLQQGTHFNVLEVKR